MAISLIPDCILDDVTKITPELLHGFGVRLLMMDFDNTLVPYTADVPAPEIEAWLAAMQQSDITLCMVSNSKRDRVKAFCDARGIPCIRRAKKPLWWVGIRTALNQFRCHPCEAAIVGDQIYTDTLGGNGAGVTTILIRPIHLHNIWLRLRHVAEKPFIAIGKGRVAHE
ncbi:MAG: YqeG family HAD IIIA-type phosphatase [Oscillospiraceae bacterium]|nr:YqeG family HAD IIIA-type phosphatase [Oscillospiraceae bacterium]